jgi:biopolymer transport protein ExbD
MLSSQSILHESSLQSTLESESQINPKHGKWKRNINADLLLTALIDAFSILVIFLLMSFSSTGDILFLNKNTELPKAALATILERNPVVKIDENKLYVEDKEVTTESIVAELLEVRKKFTDVHPNEEYPGIVTIQADRRVKYEQLNSIVLAASHAGFSDVRFAVTMK